MESIPKGSSQAPERVYPPRLYPEGDSNLDNLALSHNIKMNEIAELKDIIGADVWEEIKQLPVGIMARLAESPFVWSAKTVHYLLCRQLRVRKKEVWCLLGGNPIRFGLNEFGEATGLNIDPIPTQRFQPQANYEDFLKNVLRVAVPGEGPTLRELRTGISVCRTWPSEHRKWLALLFLIAVGLYGQYPNSRVPIECAKRVFDDEAMRNYPWGRTAYLTLVNAIKMLNPTGDSSYTLSGMVFVLQAWAYKAVDCFGARFGKLVNEEAVPLFRWGGNRTRSTLETVIAEEINKHGEVRVRKMVMKENVRELFHDFPGQEVDPAVDNLIQDIHEDSYVSGYWDVKRNKNKKTVKPTAAVESSHPAKKQKLNKDKETMDVSISQDDESGEEDVQKTKKKKKKMAKEEDVGSDVSFRTILEIVSKTYDRLDGVDNRLDNVESSFRDMATNLEKVVGDRVEERLDERYGPRISTVETRVGSIENEMKQIKDQLKGFGVGVIDQNDDQSQLKGVNNTQKRGSTPQKPDKQTQAASINCPPVSYRG